MSLPDPTTPYAHFQHAQIEAVDLPQSHRLILTLTPLVWIGVHGTHTSPVELHFYHVQKPDVVASFFAGLTGEEIASIRFDPNRRSTYRTIYTQITLERRQQDITVQSQDLIILPKQILLPTPIDGVAVADWLAQELRSIILSKGRAQHRQLRSLFEQLADYAMQLSAQDKSMIMNRVLDWQDVGMIQGYKIPSDEPTLHLLEDAIGTIDGILTE